MTSQKIRVLKPFKFLFRLHYFSNHLTRKCFSSMLATVLQPSQETRLLKGNCTRTVLNTASIFNKATVSAPKIENVMVQRTRVETGSSAIKRVVSQSCHISRIKYDLCSWHPCDHQHYNYMLFQSGVKIRKWKHQHISYSIKNQQQFEKQHTWDTHLMMSVSRLKRCGKR